MMKVDCLPSCSRGPCRERSTVMASNGLSAHDDAANSHSSAHCALAVLHDSCALRNALAEVSSLHSGWHEPMTLRSTTTATAQYGQGKLYGDVWALTQRLLFRDTDKRVAGRGPLVLGYL
jgi:hypothetical protein